MKVLGFHSVESQVSEGGFLCKLIANESGVILFPYTTEHRDAGVAGIQYQDDSQGNALAAMVKENRIEFRFHKSFSDERVRNIARKMLALKEMSFAKRSTVTYQARILLEPTEMGS